MRCIYNLKKAKVNNTFLIGLIVILFASGCSDDTTDNNGIVWNGVTFDGQLIADTHDPRVNYVLIIDDSNNIQIVPPSEGMEERITKIEILNETEMDLTWSIRGETRTNKTTYRFENENELTIDRFIYSFATIPFPANLVPGKFIREPLTIN